MDVIEKPDNSQRQRVEDFFGKELQSLYRYACYKIGDSDAASDVIQELYLKLHSCQLGEIGNLRCYLYRALTNSCTQRLRNRNKERYVDIDTISNLLPTDMTPSDFTEEHALIERLLSALPPEQSEVIRLHLHGGCTFSGVAEIMDIPLPTAKSRYRYGIEHLRRELQKQKLI